MDYELRSQVCFSFLSSREGYLHFMAFPSQEGVLIHPLKSTLVGEPQLFLNGSQACPQR